MPPAFARLVGIPWTKRGRSREGADCWGLHRLAVLDGRGIELPLWDAVSSTDRDAIAAAGQQALELHWEEIADGAEQPFDLILLAPDGIPSHCGTVGGRGLMLHVERPARPGVGGTSCIEPYRGPRARYPIRGFYRLRELSPGPLPA